MGRKKKRPAPSPRDRVFCYYCDRNFSDEQTLLAHQREKHLRCPICHKRMISVQSLTVHADQMHNTKLNEIPNAIEGRSDITVEVLGMKGIPESYYATAEANKVPKLGTHSAYQHPYMAPHGLYPTYQHAVPHAPSLMYPAYPFPNVLQSPRPLVQYPTPSQPISQHHHPSAKPYGQQPYGHPHQAYAQQPYAYQPHVYNSYPHYSQGQQVQPGKIQAHVGEANLPQVHQVQSNASQLQQTYPQSEHAQHPRQVSHVTHPQAHPTNSLPYGSQAYPNYSSQYAPQAYQASPQQRALQRNQAHSQAFESRAYPTFAQALTSQPHATHLPAHGSQPYPFVSQAHGSNVYPAHSQAYGSQAHSVHWPASVTQAQLTHSNLSHTGSSTVSVVPISAELMRASAVRSEPSQSSVTPPSRQVANSFGVLSNTGHPKRKEVEGLKNQGECAASARAQVMKTDAENSTNSPKSKIPQLHKDANASGGLPDSDHGHGKATQRLEKSKVSLQKSIKPDQGTASAEVNYVQDGDVDLSALKRRTPKINPNITVSRSAALGVAHMRPGTKIAAQGNSSAKNRASVSVSGNMTGVPSGDTKVGEIDGRRNTVDNGNIVLFDTVNESMEELRAKLLRYTIRESK